MSGINDSLLVRSNEDNARTTYTYSKDPLELDLVSALGEHLEIKWSESLQFNHERYLLYRYVNGRADTFIIEGKNGYYLDTTAGNDTARFQYVVQAEDECGYFNNISNPGNSILLRNRTINNRIQLDWNTYNGWPGPYRIEVQLKNGEDGSWRNLVDYDDAITRHIDENLYLEIDTPWCYRVLAIKEFGDRDTSFSNVACNTLSNSIFIPNAFTPNGDGLNDYFVLGGEMLYRNNAGELSDFNLKIFDRWGEIIFHTTDPNQFWDGRREGELVPAGTYLLIINGKTVDGQEIEENNVVHVIR